MSVPVSQATVDNLTAQRQAALDGATAYRAQTAIFQQTADDLAAVLADLTVAP